MNKIRELLVPESLHQMVIETTLRNLALRQMAGQIAIPLDAWCPEKPTAKQLEFLALQCLEAFYGGAAGGGKSSALLMAALQYVQVPSYAAILFRRSYTDLALPGALMDRAQRWLGGTAARWNERDKTWTFPSNATVSFGYLEHDLDKFRYQGAEFQFIGFDEATAFTESQYRFLFSRLRRLEGSDIPLRMRAASNPGGVGHEWVRQRFIDAPQEERVWIRATLQDNPYLDQKEYTISLSNLDPITRQQLLHGDWSARQAGGLFRREWFTMMDERPTDVRLCRYWDLAATEEGIGEDPDWTAGVLLGLDSRKNYYVCDVRRIRGTPSQVAALIRQTAEIDGKHVTIAIEQEPGASGVLAIDYYVRDVLQGWAVRGYRSTGSKVERAQPVSSQAEAGNIKLVRGGWLSPFLDELEAFPTGAHDDQIDALSGAYAALLTNRALFLL